MADLQVYDPPLEDLEVCLAADQYDIFHLEQGKKSVPSVIRVQNKANFDLWWCECELIVPTSEVKICNSCTSAFCGSCAEEGSFCDGCAEFICRECEEGSDDRFLMDCDGCGERFCQECHLSQKFNICRGGPCSDKEGTDKRCFKAYCKPCQKKKNVTFGMCFECFGVWCLDCAYDKDGPCLNICFGQGGCYKAMCQRAMRRRISSTPFASAATKVGALNVTPAWISTPTPIPRVRFSALPAQARD